MYTCTHVYMYICTYVIYTQCIYTYTCIYVHVHNDKQCTYP